MAAAVCMSQQQQFEPRVLSLRTDSSSTLRLKYFAGGSRDELLAGVRDALGVTSHGPLRFRDRDGDMVLITPDMPSHQELHVKVDAAPGSRSNTTTTTTSSILRPLTAAAADSDHWCRWQRVIGCGAISGGGRTFTGAAGTTSGWSAYTPALPTSGRHYFVLRLSSRPSWVTLGAVAATVPAVTHDRHALSSAHPCLVPVRGLGNGPQFMERYGAITGCMRTALAVGVLFNADARTLTFVRANDPANAGAAVRVDSVPLPAALVITGPAKYGVAAEMESAPLLPNFNCNLGAAAAFDKVAQLKSGGVTAGGGGCDDGGDGGALSDSSGASCVDESESVAAQQQQQQQGCGNNLKRKCSSQLLAAEAGVALPTHKK